MARIRAIKPQLWTEGDVADLSPSARLLYVGARNFTLCDYGHLADDPRQLRMQVLPGDDAMMVRDPAGAWTVTPLDPFVLVEEIVASGRWERITAGGRTFLVDVRFTEDQKLDKRWTPRCLACAALAPPGGDPDDEQPPLPGTTPNHTEPRRASPKLPDPHPRTGQDRTGPSAAAAAEAREPRRSGRGEQLPTSVEILRSKMQAHTVLAALRWDDLRRLQVDQLEDLIGTHGDARLVDVALRTARNPPPIHASAFIGTWASLPPPGQRLAVVPQRLCPTHGTTLTPAGVCSSCESDRKERIS